MENAARRLRTRLAHAAARARDEPLGWTAAQIVLRLASLAAWLVLLPLAVVLHLAGARRLPVITQRIGHLAAEIDCFAKERALGHLPARRWFVAAPASATANRHLLGYWREQVSVVGHPLLARLLRLACRPPLAAHDIADYVLTQHGASRYAAVNAQWGARPALLALRDEDRAAAAAALAELGVPRGAWFVCVHVRGAGYASHDDRVHAYRNSTPAHLAPAIAAIARRGGWCVQMGDASAPRLPAAPNLVAYAHHRLRSERLDIALCALARFFLGSSSGLFLVSTAFGVRSAIANLVPLSVRPYATGDLYIPKLYRSMRDGRVLPFDEVLASPLGDIRHSRRFQDAGVELVENTPEEIADLVEDMFDGGGDPAFDRLLRPQHYGYGSEARVSARFLARHRALR